jgi:UDP-GlcNAc:undecaprenyl-phosphate GlcNAc-1-phosphate transferase
MGIPIIDTISVMAQRIIKGRSPFIADKKHLHHKLMRIGFHHSESVLTIYLMHAIIVCIAFIFRFQSPWVLLCFYILYSGVIITTLFIAERSEWKIKRYPIIDNLIKAHLRTLKDENIIIKFAFKAVEIGFIFLLLFTCFLPEHIHIYFSFAAIAYLGLILITWKFRKDWTSIVIEISIFMMIPFLIYLSETDVVYLAGTILKQTYIISFGILMCFVLLTLKFSRRTGFKTTPTDFLIIFVALIVPNLPDQHIKSWQMSFVAAKIVSLYFCYEVLKGELRSDSNKLKTTGIFALLVISIRGFIG